MRPETEVIGSRANENLQASLSHRTFFPRGTKVRIWRSGRSVMSSGSADTKYWRMTFSGPGRRFIEPLMGWTGTTDPLACLELKFPTLEAAIRYARRQGLNFTVDGLPAEAAMPVWPQRQEDAPAVVQKQAA